MIRFAPVLHVPAVLTFALVAASACPGDDDDEGDGTAAQTSTDTGGTIDCAAVLEMAECDAAPACMWEASLGFCVTDCATIDDQATCNMESYCFWVEGECTLVT